MERARLPRPYADPYVAGVGLGLVLLAAFVLVGRGLGASGAFGATATGLVSMVDAPRAQGSAPISRVTSQTLADRGASGCSLKSPA